MESAMNGDTYRKQRLPRLKPFVEKHHAKEDVIFWPDLASAHYEKSVLEELTRLNIKVVKRDDNPPAVPQLRPIEKFWALLKAAVYEDGWQAENEQELQSRIVKKLKEVPAEVCQRLMAQVKTKVRRVSDGGHQALLRL